MNTEMTMNTREPTVPEKIQQHPVYAPPVDIFENKDELVILADLPGVSKEDLKIHLEKDQLTIEGRRSNGSLEEEAFDYRRTFVVPSGIDGDRITANLQNGVVKLVLPKPAAMKPRQIEVKAG